MALRVRLADGTEDIYDGSRTTESSDLGDLTTEVLFSFDVDEAQGLSVIGQFRCRWHTDTDWQVSPPERRAYYRPDRWLDARWA